MKPIRLLLVDDNPTFLDMLDEFLQEKEDLLIVGTARESESAITQTQLLQPDVILLDIRMPGMNGLEAIPRLREALPGVGIVILTIYDLAPYRKAALAAGANEFVSKQDIFTRIVPSIRKVVQNDCPLRQ